MPLDVRLVWAPAPGDRAARRSVSWALLRDLLAQEGHPDATLTNPCPRCGEPHGPVQVADAPWRAAVAYAGGVAVAAVHPDDAAAFAIDAEPVADAQREAAGGAPGGLLHWVRAEAVLKADGRGLRLDPAHVVIEDVPGGSGLSWTARLAESGVRYRGAELDGPPGVLVSAAVREDPAAPARRATARTGRRGPGR